MPAVTASTERATTSPCTFEAIVVASLVRSPALCATFRLNGFNSGTFVERYRPWMRICDVTLAVTVTVNAAAAWTGTDAGNMPASVHPGDVRAHGRVRTRDGCDPHDVRRDRRDRAGQLREPRRVLHASEGIPRTRTDGRAEGCAGCRHEPFLRLEVRQAGPEPDEADQFPRSKHVRSPRCLETDDTAGRRLDLQVRNGCLRNGCSICGRFRVPVRDEIAGNE